MEINAVLVLQPVQVACLSGVVLKDFFDCLGIWAIMDGH